MEASVVRKLLLLVYTLNLGLTPCGGKLVVKASTVPDCTIWVSVFTQEQYFLVLLHRFPTLLSPLVVLLGIWKEWRTQRTGL